VHIENFILKFTLMFLTYSVDDASVIIKKIKLTEHFHCVEVSVMPPLTTFRRKTFTFV